MDDTDRRIINGLQGGFPICDHPFAVAAGRLGLAESELIDRLGRLCEEGWLSRFGPLYNADRLGGATALAAMSVPDARFAAVVEMVNAYPEVAHNYARNHTLNMWFVIATDDPDRIDAVVASIEAETGLKVFFMPKIEEFFVGLRLDV
jgi:DNA-binding Lrp family transcriptional regulator